MSGTAGHALVNVRISDGGNTAPPMHLGGAITNRDSTLEPDHLSPTMVMVGIGATLAHAVTAGDVFAEPPHEHRALPSDIFASNRTCTITAWAENDADEVISPVASLTTLKWTVGQLSSEPPWDGCRTAPGRSRVLGTRKCGDSHPWRVAVLPLGEAVPPRNRGLHSQDPGLGWTDARNPTHPSGCLCPAPRKVARSRMQETVEYPL